MYDWRTLRSSDWFKKAAANWTKMRESWRTWWTVGLFNRWMSSSWSLTQFMSPFLFFTQRHNSFRAETNVLSNVLSLKIKFQLFFSINLYLTKFQKKLFTVWVSSALIFGKTHEFRTHLCFSQVHPLLKKKKINLQLVCLKIAFESSWSLQFKVINLRGGGKDVYFWVIRSEKLHATVVTLWCLCVFRNMIHSK